MHLRIPAPLRRLATTVLAGLSLLLLLGTVFAFLRLPDLLAAFTAMPIWLWGGIGAGLSLAAFGFTRGRLPLALTGLWVVVLLVGADEVRPLARPGKAAPQPGEPATHHGRQVIRVIALNCGLFHFGDPSADIAVWQPDIVLLQEAWSPHARTIANTVFGENAHILSNRSNAIVSRWQLKPPPPRPGGGRSRNHHATVVLPDGGEIDLLNLHLATAATDLRFWDPDAWRDHRNNRRLRREELVAALAQFREATGFPERPAIIGGDFNAPANDIVHKQLRGDVRDAFAAVGTGWGNTYHRRFAILRIDHLHATRHVTPVRSRAHTTRLSDHRMVIADFLPPATPAPNPPP